MFETMRFSFRALDEIPYVPHVVETPTAKMYEGLKTAAQIVGVSILRAGGTLEVGLRRVLGDIAIGKILIQTDPSNGEPQLHYCKLPQSIHAPDCYVFLCDAVIGTGAAALMAIRVLLDYSVPQDRIVFLCFLAGPQGLHVITNAFPKVKIVTSYIDPVLNADTLYLEPGMGQFADRYYDS